MRPNPQPLPFPAIIIVKDFLFSIGEKFRAPSVFNTPSVSNSSKHDSYCTEKLSIKNPNFSQLKIKKLGTL
jgi:hypothetical protein